VYPSYFVFDFGDELILCLSIGVFSRRTGGLHDFAEVWPDEGDIDMFELAETLFDAGYE